MTDVRVDLQIWGVLRGIRVADLSEAQCVVELRRIRAARERREACEFADVTDERARRRLCLQTDECGCIGDDERELAIVKRLMKPRVSGMKGKE